MQGTLFLTKTKYSMINAKNYTVGKVLFFESVVIDDITRNEHLPGHLANKVVPGKMSQFFVFMYVTSNIIPGNSVNRRHKCSGKCSEVIWLERRSQ